MGADAAAALPTPAGAAPAAAAAAPLAAVPALPARPTVKLACCCGWWLLSAPMMRWRCHVAVTGSRLNSQEGQYLVSSLSVNTYTEADHRVTHGESMQVTGYSLQLPTDISYNHTLKQVLPTSVQNAM